MNINNTNILELIEKEKQLQSKLSLYESMNREYINIGTIDTYEKKQKLKNLINNMLATSESIKVLANSTGILRESLNQYNINLEKLKVYNVDKLKDIINSINTTTLELNDINDRLNSADGSNSEFSKIYESNNIKYLFFVFITILLIIVIIKSLTNPNESYLEKFIFIIIIIVALYYFYIFIKTKMRTIDLKKKTNEITNYLNPSRLIN